MAERVHVPLGRSHAPEMGVQRSDHPLHPALVVEILALEVLRTQGEALDPSFMIASVMFAMHRFLKA
jgi:hypothetical protein